jgi:Ca2+-transporting ATPase
LNDWQKERQFKKLNEKKDERGVKVIREGVEQVIDVKVKSQISDLSVF